METRKPIPTIVVAYHDLGMVRETLACLSKLGNRLSITVVENHSVNTNTHLRPYFASLLDQKIIDRYILFRRNISNNALEVVFDACLIPFDGMPLVLMTDGDIVPNCSDWLDEQIEVLEQNPAVFVCGIQLTTDNLPLTTFPEASHWIPAPIAIHADYIETPQSGLHLCLFRSADFLAFLRYRFRTGHRFVDSSIGAYVALIGRKWALARWSTARHLVWDLYSDRDHPYTQLKLARSFNLTWNHYNYCACDIWTRDSHRVHLPISPLINVPYAVLRRGIGAIKARIRA